MTWEYKFDADVLLTPPAEFPSFAGVSSSQFCRDGFEITAYTGDLRPLANDVVTAVAAGWLTVVR